MAAPSEGWESHIWTHKSAMQVNPVSMLEYLVIYADNHTLRRLMRQDQEQIQIQSCNSMPLTISVFRALLQFYCPGQNVAAGTPLLLGSTRDIVLNLFSDWLYTGQIENAAWDEIVELYVLGSSLSSIALMRSAMSELQKICRNDTLNHTQLFDQTRLATIKTQIDPSSALFHYVEDTYFNHWTLDDAASHQSNDPSEIDGLMYKRLFARSINGEREGSNCSCCHDYCKYHEHESDAERLASKSTFDFPTCLLLTASDLACGIASSFSGAQRHAAVSQTTITQAKASKRPTALSTQTTRKSMVQRMFGDSDQDMAYETRSASRAATPDKTWLDVHNQAPVHFPANHHGLLTSLPLVNSIKSNNWLEIGLGAEGVDKLPEPDRIIASAMGWTGEEYAQTKCMFFEQYAHNMLPGVAKKTRDHWRNILKFGGGRSKERADRLLDMWEILGWLDMANYNMQSINDKAVSDALSLNNASHQQSTMSEMYVHQNQVAALANNRSIRRRRTMPEKSLSGLDTEGDVPKTGSAVRNWSEHEDQALVKILKSLETRKLGTVETAKICSERLASEYGVQRSLNAVAAHRRKMDTEVDTSNIGGGNRVGLGSNDSTSVSEAQAAFTKKGSAWTAKEDETLINLFDGFRNDPKYATAPVIKCYEACSQRMQSVFNSDRTPIAVRCRVHFLKGKRQREDDDEDGADDGDDSDEDMQSRQRSRPRLTAQDAFDAEEYKDDQLSRELAKVKNGGLKSMDEEYHG
jgi:hypothetical protein